MLDAYIYRGNRARNVKPYKDGGVDLARFFNPATGRHICLSRDIVETIASRKLQAEKDKRPDPCPRYHNVEMALTDLGGGVGQIPPSSDME